MWALAAPDQLTWNDCMHLAYEYEFRQSRGGGADHLAIVNGGYTLSRGIDGSMPELISKLPAEHTATWMCTVVHTGIPKSCSNTIARVRHMAVRDPHRIESYIADCDEVALQIWDHIGCINLSGLLQCIDSAHHLHARYLDVTSPTIEDLRNSLRKQAGIPFKLTGSGEGGCLFTLHEIQDQARILKATKTAGVPKNQVYQCQLSRGAETQWNQILDSTY
jgi:mevalonate kinase